MTIFELLFLLLSIAALVTVIASLIFAAHGQFDRAGKALLRLGICTAIYLAIVVGVSRFTPRKMHHVGDMQCFDDWCITVVEAHRSDPVDSQVGYDVTLRLSSRAKRVPMGEKGTVVYLTDAQGSRFDPEADSQQPSFDTLLQPGESITTLRHFRLPADTHEVGLIYTHEGGFPIGSLIIAESGWFLKSPIVWLE